MRYLSVCSGIEAATVAWHPLGWSPVAFSEVDKFPSAVLAHHYPAVPNYGDMTKFQEWPDADVDLLVGGTPCQSFSVAGLRAGLDDPRGNLMLVYLALARRYRPRWVVWENVPGVLSSNSGRDFGTFLGGLAECGYGFAYRVLDAQYFGLAQRRKRVFVVGHLGDWHRAAAVLFERASLSGHPAPRREAGQVAPTLPSRRTGGGGLGGDFDYDGGLIAAEVASALETTCHDYSSADGFNMIAHSLKAEGFDASEDGTGRGTPLVAEPYTLAIRGRGDSHNLEYRQDGIANAILTPNGGRGGIGVGAVAFDARQSNVIQYGDMTGPLDTDGHTIAVAFATEQEPKWSEGLALTLTKGSPTGGGQPHSVEFQPRIGRNGRGYSEDVVPALGGADAGATSDMRPCVASSMAVRRLTPRECARLQGFPDTYIDILYRGKPAADGNKYKALGNSMAVPVMHWIGKRIEAVDNI